ncbi:hypothetical protein RB601_002409 [Gaeumannomyces tritici]
MASRPPGVPNGGENGQTPPGAADMDSQFTRPFTLYEALPFSPFTSVIPFQSGVIPNPTLGSGFPASDLPQQVPRQDFDTLTREASQQAPSRRLNHAIDQVQHLLNPNNVNSLTFRKGPKMNTGANAPQSKSLASELSPFARMVFERSNVSFRYPSPDSTVPQDINGAAPPTPVPTKKRKSLIPSKAESPAGKRHTAVLNKQANAHNSKIEISIPLQPPAARPSGPSIPTPEEAGAPLESLPSPSDAFLPYPTSTQQVTSPRETPQRVSPSAPPEQSDDQPIPDQRPRDPPAPSSSQQARMEIQINLPAFVPDADKYRDYKNLVDLPADLSRPRQRNAYNEPEEYGMDLDRSQKSDAAFQDVRRHFSDVFVAEMNLSTQSTASPLVTTTNEDVPTITSAGQQRTYQLIDKAIDLRCFEDIPLEDLLHIQRLSDGALQYAEGLEAKLDSEWGEVDVFTWASQLPILDNGLRAARTSLKIMAGGRDDKQLYSEDTIRLAVNLFKNVMDGIAVPVTELRQSQQLFSLLASHKKSILVVFTSCQRLYTLMASLIRAIDLSETVVNTLEFLSTRLVFVENAPSERESLLGTPKFDGLRLIAMDMLSQIFVLNPSQRQGIFDEMLTSLEKLPVGKQSARQFKLVDGRCVQTVSALILRLVQASAGQVGGSFTKGSNRRLPSARGADGDDEDDEHGGTGSGGPSRRRTGAIIATTITSEAEAADEYETVMRELKETESSLVGTAYQNAFYVMKFIVTRALNSTKSGDSPYRNLLDLFVEDFITCLESPDWPAAEALLDVVCRLMRQQVDTERTSAPAKNMALEILGSICAAISKLRSQVRKTGSLLSTVESDPLSLFLSDLAAASLKQRVNSEQMVDWSGPFRAVLEHLGTRLREDPHLTSAISFLCAQWADVVSTTHAAFQETDGTPAALAERDREFGRLAYRLHMVIQDPKWLSTQYEFREVSPIQARASYAIILDQSKLGSSFKPILGILIHSMSSDQATVRSKSLKSINQVIETDPSILDGESSVVSLIKACLTDSSPQVRDSALGLVGRCIMLRPALEMTLAMPIIERFMDAGVGVRKRSMKLTKDIYMRQSDRELRSCISQGLLHRVATDPDEGVKELARQTIEEIWIFPFYHAETSAADKKSLADHIDLMVHTVKQGLNVAMWLEKVLQSILSPTSKTARQNFEACRTLVAGMFDLVPADGPEGSDSSSLSGKDVLQVLQVFAKADPRLFDFEQIRLLRPHVLNITMSMTPEEIVVTRAAVVIYRRVLPELSGQHHQQFLADILKVVMPAVSKIYSRPLLLDDVIACLWIICGITGEEQKLATLAASALAGAANAQKGGTLDAKKILAYCPIIGHLGKHCDLDKWTDIFKQRLPVWKGKSTSQLMVDTMLPLSRADKPMVIRRSALEAIGLVCQSHPRNYVSPSVYKMFQDVFDKQDISLESIVLRSFKEFLMTEERRSDQASQAAALNGTGTAAEGGVSKKELTVMGGTNYDDVASATTQRFLAQITRIALATMDAHALLAAEVLGSINRQGLVHPKETGVTMMTLETSPRKDISELAFREHKLLHEKHESVLEREYARTLQSIFQYHRDVVGDIRGATRDDRSDTFASKLNNMMEHLKISKSKNRQGFLRKVCGLIDFDPAKLDVSQQPHPTHLMFARFLLENMAYFEYITVGELQLAISTLERLVTSTGANIAHAIESEVFQIGLGGTEAVVEGQDQQQQSSFALKVDPVRLRKLTAGSVILSAAWEVRTYLRRLYGLKAERRPAEGKNKVAAKDLSKTPVKVQNVTGDKLWEDLEALMSSLSSDELMVTQCRAFVDLLNIDKEFKVADEDGDDGEGPSTPSADEDDEAPDSASRGRKRKASHTPGGGGRKKRPRSTSQPRKRGRPRKNPLPEPSHGDW